MCLRVSVCVYVERDVKHLQDGREREKERERAREREVAE